MNDKQFKINEKNNPRVMANTFSSSKDQSIFNKSIFTLCGYRKSEDKEKMSPWTIQATKWCMITRRKLFIMTMHWLKFTIYQFYIPKLAPDPTVDRRSGFLPATLSDTKNLGSGVKIPFF